MRKATSDRQLNRRRLLTLAGSGAVALGASSFPAPHVRSAESRKIRFMNVETIAGSKEILTKAAEEYKKLRGVEVEIDTNSLDQTWIKLQASIRAGKPYELFMDGFIGHIAVLAAENALVPLTELTNKYKWGPRVLFPINGEVYWYPYDYNFASMHYNRDEYARLGVKPARTHAEYLAINKAMTDVGQGKYGSLYPITSGAMTNWETTGFLWAEDVKLFDDKWNVIIDSPQMRPRVERVLDFMFELASYMPKDIASAGWVDGMNGFLAGKVGHYAFVPTQIENAVINKTPLEGKIGLTTFPSSDGRRTGLCHGYDGIGVTKSANADEAVRFLEWYGENGYIDFAANRPLFYQPARLDVYDHPKYRDSEIVKKNPDVIGHLKGLLTNSDVIIRSIDTEGPEISEKAGKAFQSWAIPIMFQERILKNTPAGQCVDIAARLMRQAIAS